MSPITRPLITRRLTDRTVITRSVITRSVITRSVITRSVITRSVIALVVIALPACAAGHPHPVAPTTTVPAPAVRAPTIPAAGTTTSPATRCSQTTGIDAWPLERRAAQLVALPALDGAVSALASPISAGAGGVLLLGNYTPADLAAQIALVRSGAAIAPFVMADEEGGGVQRLAGRVDSLPWPRQMAATMTPAAVEAAADRVGTQMRALGVDVDLAPVLDVDGGPGPDADHPDGLRSFSADPTVAARYGTAFVRGLLEAGEIPVVKHFPGLGGSSANTDDGPAATLPLALLRSRSFPVFSAAIAAGAPAVMVANASVPGASAGPASLSASVIEQLLGAELGFGGLVVTDSLSAGAISGAGTDGAGTDGAGTDLPDAFVAAVQSGADLVLFGSTLTPAEIEKLRPEEVTATFDAMVSALAASVEAGRVPQARLDAAVEAVLRAKGVDLCGLTAR